PLVGGLTPEEVQKRLQESEDSRRAEAVTSRPSPPPLQSDARLAPETPAAPTMASSPTPPVIDPIAEDERKREYVGRYASNIALSYRAESRASGFASRPASGAPSGAPDSEEPAAASPTGLPVNFQQQLEMLQAQQERLLAQQQQLTASSAPTAPTQQQQAQTAPTTHKNADLNSATGKNHVIFEGTVLESVLVNRLNGDFAGPVICQ